MTSKNLLEFFMMKYLMVATLTLLTATSAFAKKDCTNLPKDKWMAEAEFKKQAEAKGYKITKFKQPGSCYEIYGTNKEGKEVEVYFNPVDGAVVKEKLED
jgi:hypothetical protein